MCKDVVEDEFLDLKIHNHVSIELALQEPPQRLQVGDVVADLGLAAGGASAPRRHRPEDQPRGVTRPRGRPACSGLKGTIIHHDGGRCGGQAVRRQFVYRVRGIFRVLKGEDLIDRIPNGRHFERVSL